MATEECVVESRHFFLMQHEVYKEKAPNVIVDTSGKLVSTEIRKGLDEDNGTGSDEKSYSVDITISGIGLVSDLATKYKIFNA